SGQHRGLAVIDVAGGREQSEMAVSRQVVQPRPRRLVVRGLELGEVAAPKLGEPVRVVGEPLAQFRRGCDIAQPLVEAALIAADTPGPDAIHEHASSLAPPGLVVDAAEADRGLGWHPFTVPPGARPRRRSVQWPFSILFLQAGS